MLNKLKCKVRGHVFTGFRTHLPNQRLTITDAQCLRCGHKDTYMSIMSAEVAEAMIAQLQAQFNGDSGLLPDIEPPTERKALMN